MAILLELAGEPLKLEEIAQAASGALQLSLSSCARERIESSRRVVEKQLREKKVVYGINTGFGKLADVHIPDREIERLQINLVRSHASGVGEPLSEAETRALMLLRANVLATGHSGCRPVLIDTLSQMMSKEFARAFPLKDRWARAAIW